VVWYRWLAFEGHAEAPVSTVVPVQQLWEHVPADTPRLGEADRRAQLAVRRAHVARRFQR
jgi:hypothetical protein